MARVDRSDRRRRRRRALPSVPEPGSARPRAEAFETRCMFLGHGVDLLEPREPRARRVRRGADRDDDVRSRAAPMDRAPPRLRAHQGRGGRRARRALRADPPGVRARAARVRAGRRGRRRRGVPAADDHPSGVRGGARWRPGASGRVASSPGSWTRARKAPSTGRCSGSKDAVNAARQRPSADRVQDDHRLPNRSGHHRSHRPRTPPRPTIAGGPTTGASHASTRSPFATSCCVARSRSRRSTTVCSTCTWARAIRT